MDEQRDVVDSEASLPAEEDLSGRLLADKYQVMRPLGRGATGTVYLCFHATLDKQVAVKVLHPELTGDAGMVTRFQREAQAAARLDHPNTIHVSDFGHDTENDRLYIAMDYVEGRDLGQILHEDWPLSDLRVVGIMAQVLSALSAAHRLGIVHRDLKPENILIRSTAGAVPGSDDVKVCDFSIAQLSPIRLSGQPVAARSNQRLHTVTAQGTVVGTPAYMSPEQARGESQDARSDIYSAGVVLFQLLTRTVPFIAETPLSVAVMHCLTPPPPPSGYGTVNPALEAVCLKSLSKTREARYQSAREMQTALEVAIARRSGSQGMARRLSAPPPAGTAIVPVKKSRDGSLVPTERVIDLGLEPKPARRNGPLIGLGVAAGLCAIIGLPRYFDANDNEAAANAEAAPLAAAATAAPALPSLPPEPLFPAASSATPPSAPAAAQPAAAEQAHEVSVLASAARVKRPRAPALVRVRTTETTAASLDQAYSSDAPTLILPAAINDSDGHPTAANDAKPSVAAIVSEALQQASLPPASSEQALASAASTAPAAVTAATAGARNVAASPAGAAAIPHALPSASELEHARVGIGAATSHSVSKASVRAALNQTAIDRCYRDALLAGHAPASAISGQLNFATNMGGRIVSANLEGAELSKGLRQCVEQVARSGRIREADTGEAQASVTLTFQPK